MKKTIIVCVIWFAIGMFLSCCSFHNEYSSRMTGFYLKNIIFNGKSYVNCNTEPDTINSKNFCLMIFLKTTNRLLKEERLCFDFNHLPLINSAYAYDPGYMETNNLSDSIKSISITSLYDFNKHSPANTDITQYFKFKYWIYFQEKNIHSIKNAKTLENINQIDHLIKENRVFNIVLLATLSQKPYSEQRFVVKFEMYSGIVYREIARTTYFR